MQYKNLKNAVAKNNAEKELNIKKDKKEVPKNEVIRSLITEMVKIPKK
mgnify:CR=1 FL=1